MYFECLEKMNVFNDAFYIWRDGVFGMINGFCFGCFFVFVVEWEEINIVFGLVCLLLYFMVCICKFMFT